MQHPAKDTGNEAHHQRGNDGSLPHTGQLARKHKGHHHRDDRDGDVKADLGGAELGFPGHDDSTDKGLPGKHGHVGQHFQVDAKAQHHTACQQTDQLERIGLRGEKGQPDHGQVDEPAEGYRNRDLEKMLQLEVFPQNDQLK